MTSRQHHYKGDEKNERHGKNTVENSKKKTKGGKVEYTIVVFSLDVFFP
jgi:hypothetical protein